ncbi:MAG: hypothetical protein U9O54_04590 [Chloroflexota bacterium]|nr:hypothetical protein [Chloroflexota bacterium]
MANFVIQAYSNTPRRKQIRILGSFFLALLVLVVLLVSYLIVSSRVVSLGRDIQKMKNEIDELEYENVTLQDEIASVTTISEIEAIARAEGFHSASSDEILHVAVPGYKRSRSIPAPYHEELRPLVIDVSIAEYHQTLLEWIVQETIVFSDVFKGLEP